MIKEITLTRFKKFESQTFKLQPDGLTLLAGGNNSGKSTLLQALSVWEFCKTALLNERRDAAFYAESFRKSKGVGLDADEFPSIATPSLELLWTNLKTKPPKAEAKMAGSKGFPGYTMRIRCVWDWDWGVGKIEDCALEFGLAFMNNRLFIRVTDSNISLEKLRHMRQIEAPFLEDFLPTVAYLPSLAAVLPKERKVTEAEKRTMIGRGMVGSIIRNTIYELYLTESFANADDDDEEDYEGLLFNSIIRLYKPPRPLDRLQKNLREVFKCELEISNFDELYHTYLKINVRQGKWENGTFAALSPKVSAPRDIIAQGTGFLQWLSIFSLLYNESTADVILLDEPDAHLHAVLQKELLRRIAAYLNEEREGGAKKQVLIATHSAEMIRQIPVKQLYSMDRRKYLQSEESRVGILKGIGSEYYPFLDRLKQYKRLIIMENESDMKIISILGEKCGLRFPDNVLFDYNTDEHKIRNYVFKRLRQEIPDLKCVSLRDRDMMPQENVGADLTCKGIEADPQGNILFLNWRRKNIEGYLLCPRAIAEASRVSVDKKRKEVSPQEVAERIKERFSLSLPEGGRTEAANTDAVNAVDGKKYFTEEVEPTFHCDKYDVAKAMKAEEVCEDVKIFLRRVNALFSPAT